MKKMSKKLVAVVLLGVMMFCLTACGVDMSKVKGDWTTSTIAGKDITTYANDNQLYPFTLINNITITDKEIKVDNVPQPDGNHNTQTYTLKQRSNGVEGYKDDKLAISLILDEKANTLTMKMGADEASAIAYVFVKGTTDIDAAYQNYFGGSDEGGEEGGDEDYEEE